MRKNDGTTQEDFIPPSTSNCITKFHDEFVAAMLDDLHTPVALAAMSEPLKTINDLIHTRKGRMEKLREESLAALEKAIRGVLTVLGLIPSSYSEALYQLKEKALKRANLTEDEVLRKIEERNTARESKEYEQADTIRKDLAVVGVALMDSPEGTTWRPAIPLALQEQLTAAN